MTLLKNNNQILKISLISLRKISAKSKKRKPKSSRRRKPAEKIISLRNSLTKRNRLRFNTSNGKSRKSKSLRTRKREKLRDLKKRKLKERIDPILI